jgi:hypothetical protein
MTSLRQAIQDYLSLRRSLGFKLRCTGALLLKFAAFAEARGTEYVTISLALEWATLPPQKPATWADRMKAVRVFAKYQHAIDARTEVPPFGLFALPAPSFAALPLHRRGDQALARSHSTPAVHQGNTAPHLLLSARPSRRFGPAYQRGFGTAGAGRRSPSGNSHRPGHQVWEVALRTSSSFHGQRLASLRTATRFAHSYPQQRLLLRLRFRAIAGSLRRPPDLLRTLSLGQSAAGSNQPWPAFPRLPPECRVPENAE